jgi:hypothetical protein
MSLYLFMVVPSLVIKNLVVSLNPDDPQSDAAQRGPQPRNNLEASGLSCSEDAESPLHRSKLLSGSRSITNTIKNLIDKLLVRKY